MPHSKRPTTGASQFSTWEKKLLNCLRFTTFILGMNALVEGFVVKKRTKASFDPKIFLSKVGKEKTICKYRKDQIVFSQGDVADHHSHR
jgi:hypothetical protein